MTKPKKGVGSELDHRVRCKVCGLYLSQSAQNWNKKAHLSGAWPKQRAERLAVKVVDKVHTKVEVERRKDSPPKPDKAAEPEKYYPNRVKRAVQWVEPDTAKTGCQDCGAQRATTCYVKGCSWAPAMALS